MATKHAAVRDMLAELEKAEFARDVLFKQISAKVKSNTASLAELEAYGVAARKIYAAEQSMINDLRAAGVTNIPTSPPTPGQFQITKDGAVSGLGAGFSVRVIPPGEEMQPEGSGDVAGLGWFVLGRLAWRLAIGAGVIYGGGYVVDKLAQFSDGAVVANQAKIAEASRSVAEACLKAGNTPAACARLVESGQPPEGPSSMFGTVFKYALYAGIAFVGYRVVKNFWRLDVKPTYDEYAKKHVDRYVRGRDEVAE